MNYLSANIRYLRKQKGYTQTDLADKLGVNRAMVGSYEEARAIPKINVLQNLAYFFDISIDELLNIDMSNPENQEPGKTKTDITGSGLRVLSTIVDREDNEMITVVPARASAGYLNGYADPEYVESLPKFELPLQEMSKERTYRAFQIKGDSMLPIPSGAYVIGEYIQNWKEIKDGKAYVLVSKSDGVVYKRVYSNIETDETLYLKSDNPDYEPYSMPIADVIDIWKAVGYISFELPEPDDPSLVKMNAQLQEMQKEIAKLKRQP